MPNKTLLTSNPYAKTKSENQKGEHAKSQTHPENRKQASEDIAGQIPGGPGGEMEKGTYTGRRVDFGRYATAVFNPFLFSCDIRGNRGCGATTLALLTGVPPDRIARLNHYQPHYADEFMVGFVAKRSTDQSSLYRSTW